MSIAVVGTRYLGLTTGACLSHLEHDVACTDLVEAKVDLRAEAFDSDWAEEVAGGDDAGSTRDVMASPSSYERIGRPPSIPLSDDDVLLGPPDEETRWPTSLDDR